MRDISLSKNPFWKGGRTISSHGYVRIKMPDHPFADVAGYVYEHRLVMEKIIGRYLVKGEIVHHKNENKSDNVPDNLVLASNIAEHKVSHRKTDDLKKPSESNPVIKCACGCGGFLLKYDSSNRPRTQIYGHSRKNKLCYDPNETVQCACGCGTTIKKFDKSHRERKFVSGHNIFIKNPNVHAAH